MRGIAESCTNTGHVREVLSSRLDPAAGSLCPLPFCSDLKKDGYSALNTHSVSPVEKTEQYQGGQTVTCFFKKVSSCCPHCRPDLPPEQRGEDWSQLSSFPDSLALLVALTPMQAVSRWHHNKGVAVGSSRTSPLLPLCVSWLWPCLSTLEETPVQLKD